MLTATLRVGRPRGVALSLAIVVALAGCDLVAGPGTLRLESDGPASGFRVALDGSTALVASSSNGPVAVHERGPDGWTRIADLLGEGADVGPTSPDRYGWAIALDGGVAVVGAHGTDGGRGRAYVFERRGTAWEGTAVLEPDGLTTARAFGRSVAAGAGRVFVTGAEADGGVVFVYEPSPSGWRLVETIRAPATDDPEFFGGHLATDGESLVVVGAVVASATLRNAAALVYEAGGPYDAPVARLSTRIAYDELDGLPGRPRSDGGGAVAVAGDVIVVGTPNLNVEGIPSVGGAVVFERMDGTWSSPTRLLTTDPDEYDFIGRFGVAAGGGTISVSSDLSGGTGVVYTFEKVDGQWTQTGRLQPYATPANQGFGTSLSQDGDALMVGAPYERGEDGAAYVYRRSEGEWVPYTR